MRWLKIFVATAALSFAATVPACSCDNAGTGVGDGGMKPFGDGSVLVGSITIDPTDVTLDLVQGMAPPMAGFKVFYHDTKGDPEVTADSVFTLTDLTLGVMNANVFTAGTAHGGTTTLLAQYTPMGGAPQTAQATIHVKVHGTFSDPSCTGCAPFPPDTAPACAAGSEPTVIYPTDGVLVPPNLNELEVQFTQGTGDTVWEIDFKNGATDVRIETKCVPTLDTRMQMSGGCQVDLTPAMWDFIAGSNKGGDPITITVRATTDGTCASASKNASNMSITEQDIVGGLYYWKSKVTTSGTGGDIWRKSFGDKLPEELISPTAINNFTCLGCHFLSRDGKRMTLSGDDADSDDEYNDVSMGDVDVGLKKFINMVGYNQGHAPGF